MGDNTLFYKLRDLLGKEMIEINASKMEQILVLKGFQNYADDLSLHFE